MRRLRNHILVSIVMLSLVTMAALPTSSASTGPDNFVLPHQRDGQTIDEEGDETHSPGDARPLGGGDTYYGHLDRVDDRSDHFSVTALNGQVINAHVRVLGHDGVDEWVRPAATTPPSPPSPVTASAMIDCFIYHAPGSPYPLDGAFNYYYVRDYVVNICAPVPGTHAYLVNLTLNWAWTPNNHTWDYMLELDVGPVPTITADSPVEGSIDMDVRDTLWYRVWAEAGREVNGSFEVLNFNDADPEERDVNVWVFPDDLGGYPRAMAWDWSAAPNEPVEPFSVLASYGGWYYIKLRGMDHDTNLPCSFRLEVHVQDVPELPDGGVQGAHFDRHRHDTDWYSFQMRANQPLDGRPGLWNEVRYFNMTERADGGDLPDFDLYLFGLVPGSRQLDLLDSSYRNDHHCFYCPERDPSKCTEHVRAAALYNGTYYLEVNAWNNTGHYDLRMQVLDAKLSDDDNLPVRAKRIDAGVYQGHIHQAFDHYDWFKIEAMDSFRIQFDSYKGTDMFNLSFYKWDRTDEAFVYLKGGWNTVFNLTSREDEISNLIDVTIHLSGFGLGADTYYVSITAAVAAEMAYDQASQRVFVYNTDGDATADYEIRVWNDKWNCPHPPQPKPFPHTVVEEDTSLVDHLNLDEYFDSPDVGMELTYKASVVRGKLERLILNDNMLGFQAAEDFAGEVVVKVTAVDTNYLQTSQQWNITFTHVNDAPRSMVAEPPFVFTMPEDGLRQLDMNLLVHDVDRGDVLTVAFEGPGGLSIDVDPDTLLANVTGRPNWFGEELVTVTVTDMAGASVDVPVLFVVEGLADPPLLVREFGTLETVEDHPLVLDLSLYVQDPDGDPLTVLVGADPHVVSTYDASTGVLTLRPEPDWSGGRRISLTARDPDGHRLDCELWLEVDPIMDEPEIVAWAPLEGSVDLREGYGASFVIIEVRDPDSHAFFYYWYLDATLMSHSPAFTYEPGIHDQGRHELAVKVCDDTGLWDRREWVVDVEDVPCPPEGGIASPPANGRFHQGRNISFVAIYQDLDGDVLSYQWSIDGSMYSKEREFAQTLSPGDHHVTLRVSSGEDTVVEELDITVVAAADGASVGPVLVVIIGLAAIILTLMVLTRIRR